MARRKLKSGPKRPVGRPATAQKREADAARLKSERQILSEMGIVNVTIWVDEYASHALREASKIKRIDGLMSHAASVGDTVKAEELGAKLALAKIERDRALAAKAEQKAEAQRLAGAEAERRARADAAAQRLAESPAGGLQGVSSARPPQNTTKALSEAEIRSAMRQNNPHLI